MKKVMAIFLMVIGMAALFAATNVQTIVLVSVVEEMAPVYCLVPGYVENGYVRNVSSHEAAVEAFDIRKDVRVQFDILQSESRYEGTVKITVSASELEWNGFRTKGLQISGSVNETAGRTGWTQVSGNSLEIVLDYTGRGVSESVAAEVSIDYSGDSNLPQGTYVSYVRMVVEAE